jgi:hypothetical protein
MVVDEAFAPPALGYPQTFLAPQSLHRLWLTIQPRRGRNGSAATPARMIHSPLPQHAVARHPVVRGLAARAVALGRGVAR